MDIIYRFGAEHPFIWFAVLTTAILAMLWAGLAMLKPTFVRLMMPLVAAFALLAITFEVISDDNPYIRDQEVPEWKMAELDGLRNTHPEIDPLMRRAAADGKITRGEHRDLTQGPLIRRIDAARKRAETIRIRRSVLEGDPPVSTGI